MEFHPAVIRGGQIVLDANLPLPDGQRVEVVVLPIPRDRVPGEGIWRRAGASADDPDFDADMAEVLKARRELDPRASRNPQTPPGGVSAFFGTWPGDETDEEWNQIIERMRP